MRKRLESLLVDVTPRVVRERIPIFAALRRVRAKGYTLATKLTELPGQEAPPSRSLLPPDPDPDRA